MKAFVLFVAMTFAAGAAMASGGKNQVKKQDIYDETGDSIGSVYTIPEGCAAVPVQAGDLNSFIVLCGDED